MEKENSIRLLKADEIECRVATINQKGCSLLLYKDARVDMRLLDEHFGPNNWQRSHELINGNLFCTLSIWDEDKEQWISKQDVGVESYTEKEKGQASDAFKRAGFNWGIGRELYTAPFIWINFNEGEAVQKGSSYTTFTKFYVKEIEYNVNREITKVVIADNKGNVRFSSSSAKTSAKTASKPESKAETPATYTGTQLKKAIEELKAANDRVALTSVWNKYPQMQKDNVFRNTCIEQSKTFAK